METIPDLDHIQVTTGAFRTCGPPHPHPGGRGAQGRGRCLLPSAGNAQEVVEMMEGLLSNQAALSYQDLLTVLNKLKDVVTISVMTASLAQALVEIISDILEADGDLLPFTNT